VKILTLNHNLRQIGTYGRCFYFSRELARDLRVVCYDRLANDNVRAMFGGAAEYVDRAEGEWSLTPLRRCGAACEFLR
jgi:hypothetical protein